MGPRFRQLAPILSFLISIPHYLFPLRNMTLLSHPSPFLQSSLSPSFFREFLSTRLYLFIIIFLGWRNQLTTRKKKQKKKLTRELRYNPKINCTIPFSSISGPSLLTPRKQTTNKHQINVITFKEIYRLWSTCIKEKRQTYIHVNKQTIKMLVPDSLLLYNS